MPNLNMLNLKSEPSFAGGLPPNVTDLLGYEWSRDDLYTFDGTDYRFVESHTGAHHFVAHDGTRDNVLFDDEQLAQFIEAGLYGRKQGYFSPKQLTKLRNAADQLVSDLPAKDQAKVNFRLAMVVEARALLKDVKHPTDEQFKAAIEEAYQARTDVKRKKAKDGEQVYHFKRPALSTWKSWCARLDAYQGAPLALLDLRGQNSGNRSPRFGEAMLELIRETIRQYLKKEKPTVAKVHDDLLIELFKTNRERLKVGLMPLKAPHISTIYAYISKIDKYIKDALRDGIDAANRRYRATGKGLGVIRPGSRTEIDGWRIDLQTLLKDADHFLELTAAELQRLKSTRLVVIVLIDAATRCVTGIHVAMDENGDSAVAAMRMSKEPKNTLAHDLGCKSPWPMFSNSGFAADNGVFASDMVQAIAQDAFGLTMHSPLGVPWMRPIIERFFRTMSNQLLAHFTGRTFGSVREKGDYAAEKWASITVEELLEALIRYIVDVYHHTVHSSLGMTPYMAWHVFGEEFPPFPPMDKERIAAIFGIRLTRHVYGDGVVFWNQQYNSAVLQRVMRREGVGIELPIKVDPVDMGQIVVEVSVDKDGRADGEGPFDYRGWIEVPGPEALRGVTLWQYQAAVEAFNAKYAGEIKEGEQYRMEGLEFLKALGADAAKQRLTRVAYSAEYLERASRGYFPGLHQPENEVADEDLAALHGRSKKGAEHLTSTAAAARAEPKPASVLPQEDFYITFDED